jgi:hypothetical protein
MVTAWLAEVAGAGGAAGVLAAAVVAAGAGAVTVGVGLEHPAPKINTNIAPINIKYFPEFNKYFIIISSVLLIRESPTGETPGRMGLLTAGTTGIINGINQSLGNNGRTQRGMIVVD